jgi:spore coat-associated protein N
MSNLSRILVVLLLVGVVAAGLVAVATATIRWPVRRSQTSGSSQDSPPTRGKGTKTMSNLSRVLVVLLLVGVVAAGLGVASNAIWTDSDDVAGNTFNTGTVSLTTNPISAIWTAVTAGVPGDRAAGALTVTNDGTLELRYAVTGSNTNATLAAGMNLRIGLQGGGSCDFPYHNTDGTTTTLTDDTELIATTWDTTALIGDPAQGSDTGDRTLAASANEVLCFAVVLPDSAPDTLEGQSNTATFTFDSEQTVNNP